MTIKMGMNKVGLVATRDDHCATIAFANVGEGDQNIHLTTHKATCVIAILVAFSAAVAARMQANRFTRLAEVGEVFVNKERAMIVIKGALATNKIFNFIKPRGMVDQLLKGFARFIN